MPPPVTISAWHVAMDGWRLAIRAARAMPHLALSTLVAAVAVDAMNAGLAQFLLHGAPTAAEAIAARLVEIGTWQLIWASCAIAVHRFVLLGEAADRYIWQTPAQFWRFFDRLMVIQLTTQLPTLILASSPGFPGLNMALIYVFGIVGIVVALRSMLLFPAVAVDAPGIGWRNAWRDTRGQGWRLLRVSLCLAVPILPVYLVAFALGIMVFGLSALVTPLSPGSLGLGFVLQVGIVASIGATAAAASRLYQLFGTALIRVGAA